MNTQHFFPLKDINPEYVRRQKYFLLFETSLADKTDHKSYCFSSPIDVIKVSRPESIPQAFKKIQEYRKKYFIAGYFSYELGYYFEKQFRPKKNYKFPLMHLAVFDKAAVFDHKNGRVSGNIPTGLFQKPSSKEDFSIESLKFNFSKSEYCKRVETIRDYIRKGDTYQVNLTGKFKFGFKGSAFSFYDELKKRQNVPYGSFCKLGNEYILSFSPELFFRKENDRIISRPMKGTIKRGRDIFEDRFLSHTLRTNEKERAENLMIVDLIRNDLGRVCRTGTVKTKELFHIEKYRTLFQMTSTIEGKLKKNISYFDIFSNIFPGGSVTGAPKIKTMQIIRELEKESRNVYCGALGIFFPGNKAVFNLPIRTVRIEGKRAEMGIGSGIVYDAKPENEFNECMLKAKFLTQKYQGFELTEGILFDKKYRFLEAHLKRMKDSAEYFSFVFDEAKARDILKKNAKKLSGRGTFKVRMLLTKDGKITVGNSEIQKPEKGIKYAAVSKYKTDPENVFLYHKTTNRGFYDAELKKYFKKGCFDVIFLNKKNEVTEGARTNIFILKNKKYYTPPVESGILKGVYREYAIRKLRAEEKILHKKDLESADKIFLCNSVRGMVEVKIKN